MDGLLPRSGGVAEGGDDRVMEGAAQIGFRAWRCRTASIQAAMMPARCTDFDEVAEDVLAVAGAVAQPPSNVITSVSV